MTKDLLERTKKLLTEIWEESKIAGNISCNSFNTVEELGLDIGHYLNKNKIKMPVVCQGEKPSYANKYAAGLDIKSNNQVYIKPGEIIDIETLLAVEIPVGHFGMVVARSGLSYKKQIKLINDVGIIDCDYRGNIGIRLINEGKEPYMIEKGDRIAQMIIIPYVQPELVYVDELSETQRGKGGFGHTGR